MNAFKFEVEGIDVSVYYSGHAVQRLNEREINPYQVSGAVVMLGEEILDMKSGHEFIIIDEDLESSYVFAVHADRLGEVSIDVITVVDAVDIWNKKETQILRLK